MLHRTAECFISCNVEMNEYKEHTLTQLCVVFLNLDTVTFCNEMQTGI